MSQIKDWTSIYITHKKGVIQKKKMGDFQRGCVLEVDPKTR